jgi:hypothetical protein
MLDGLSRRSPWHSRERPGSVIGRCSIQIARLSWAWIWSQPCFLVLRARRRPRDYGGVHRELGRFSVRDRARRRHPFAILAVVLTRTGPTVDGDAALRRRERGCARLAEVDRLERLQAWLSAGNPDRRRSTAMSNSTDTKHLGNKVDRDKPYVVGNKKPSANRRDPADLRLTPMLLGDQEDVEGRPPARAARRPAGS